MLQLNFSQLLLFDIENYDELVTDQNLPFLFKMFE